MKAYLKHIAFALVLLTLLPVGGCKKGKDDPGISFLSRTERLSGLWKIEAIESTHVVHWPEGNSPEHKIFVDGLFFVSEGPPHLPPFRNEIDEYFVEFRENGEFKFFERFSGRYPGGNEWSEITTISGNWSFLPGNDDFKNKERVLISITEEEWSNNITTPTGDKDDWLRTEYSDGEKTWIWNLEELRNDKLEANWEHSLSRDWCNGQYLRYPNLYRPGITMGPGSIQLKQNL